MQRGLLCSLSLLLTRQYELRPGQDLLLRKRDQQHHPPQLALPPLLGGDQGYRCAYRGRGDAVSVDQVSDDRNAGGQQGP